MRSLLLRRNIVAWALYDWANSAFATTIMAGFFPVFFKQYWTPEGVTADVSTFRLGFINGVSSLVVALLAPALGAIADQGGIRLRSLIVFTGLGVVMTGSLYFVEKGDWLAAVMLFGMASIGFSGANIFYDSLLVDVAPREDADLISSYGFALGYLGGGLLFLLNVLMTLYPATFGLADAAAAVRASFVMVALWWLLFSVPIMLFVREQRIEPRPGLIAASRAGMRRLVTTFREIRRYPAVFMFLLAYWLYIDGVNTIQKMAVDFGLALGFPTNSLITALLLVQFIAFPSALAFGYLARWLGTLPCIFIGIGVYSLLTCYAVFLSNVAEFYVLAIVVGLVQGGIQALSRSYMGKLTPPERAGEFFGFYNMLGKFAAVLGPFLTGGVTLLTGSTRIGIFSLLVLFLGGAAVLAMAQRYPRAIVPVSSQPAA